MGWDSYRKDLINPHLKRYPSIAVDKEEIPKVEKKTHDSHDIDGLKKAPKRRLFKKKSKK